ncbi:MAG TPA: alpha/beta hydrolase, partial [Dehalococcoidia bacterium]
LEPFAARHRVIMYSQRYYWPNPRPTDLSGYTTANHAADLAALIETLDLEPAFVVGTSYGAYITLTMTIAHPELIRGLVIAEPPILSWMQDTVQDRALLAPFTTTAVEPSRAALASGDLEEGLRIFIDGVVGSPGTFDALPSEIRGRMMENAPLAEAGLREPYLPMFTRNEAQRITAPVLLVQGAESPSFFGRILDQLQQNLPNCERVTIPNASHTMWGVNPKACNEAALGFLSRQ